MSNFQPNFQPNVATFSQTFSQFNLTVASEPSKFGEESGRTHTRTRAPDQRVSRTLHRGMNNATDLTASSGRGPCSDKIA